jgi:hypothetical protein
VPRKEERVPLRKEERAPTWVENGPVEREKSGEERAMASDRCKGAKRDLNML